MDEQETTGAPAGWLPVPVKSRAAGGLLAVVATEAWRGPAEGFTTDNDLPVSAALFDLCAAYVVDPVDRPPEVARRHDGVPGPGWLLPVALAGHNPAWRADETRRLAEAGGLEPPALDACIAYVELAAAVVDDTAGAIIQAHGVGAALTLSGIGTVDGLAAGYWVLRQPGPPIDTVRHLVECAPPWVVAAAAGLLGLRHGPALIPSGWRTQRRRGVRLCGYLADGLLAAAATDQLLGS